MKFLEHKYGPKVKILENDFLTGVLARLCEPSCFQPEINQLVHLLYTHLIQTVVNVDFDKEKFQIKTRMSEFHPDQLLSGTRISQEQKAVCVNLARAGTFPSHICYDFLHFVLKPEYLRQDHIFAARITNDQQQVQGTHLGSHKIGGGVAGAHVIFPDPMGATGNTLVSSVDYYKKKIQGPAKSFIAINLIVTPEYLANLTKAHPEVSIFALRVDRGLSSERALRSIPGQFWAEERGLNDKHYIVPGGGGFGEILNNSFV